MLVLMVLCVRIIYVALESELVTHPFLFILHIATVILSQMTLPASKLTETRMRLDERVSRLSKVIVMDLGQPHITKVTVQRDVGWLERLGCLEQARDVFLSNRTKVVHQRIRYWLINVELRKT